MNNNMEVNGWDQNEQKKWARIREILSYWMMMEGELNLCGD